MIRILYCIDAMVPGGTENQLAALIHGLDRARVAPALCTLKPSTMDLSAFSCPTLELQFQSFRKVGIIECLRRFRRFVIDQQIDIIQTFFRDPTLMTFLVARGTPVKARIASFRDMGFWRTHAYGPLTFVHPRLEGFIANSVAVARRAHEIDGLPLEKIEVIPNGVAIGPQRSQKTRQTPPVVGIVANLNRPVKRVDLFLEAAACVDRTVRCEFVIVGEGHLRAELEQQAARLGIRDRVRFVGSPQNVQEHVRQFDVGVLGSDSEGLSNAILEYMAAGVPTVARDVGGNREAVVDNATGLLVGSADPGPLADAILALLTDDERRERMSVMARQRAERDFSMAACVRRHEAYYARLLRQCEGHAEWRGAA